MKIPQKVTGRITSGLKRFRPILQAAHARDINESDTVVIITDVLQYVLGYDKYAEITSEHAIRGTYCDLAIKIDGRLALISDPVLDTMRRELRRISPDARIETDEICAVLVNEVLKREVLEGDRASAAKRLVARASGRTLRKAPVQPVPQPAPPADALPPTT